MSPADINRRQAARKNLIWDFYREATHRDSVWDFDIKVTCRDITLGF